MGGAGILRNQCNGVQDRATGEEVRRSGSSVAPQEGFVPLILAGKGCALKIQNELGSGSTWGNTSGYTPRRTRRPAVAMAGRSMGTSTNTRRKTSTSTKTRRNMKTSTSTSTSTSTKTRRKTSTSTSTKTRRNTSTGTSTIRSRSRTVLPRKGRMPHLLRKQIEAFVDHLG